MTYQNTIGFSGFFTQNVPTAVACRTPVSSLHFGNQLETYHNLSIAPKVYQQARLVFRRVLNSTIEAQHPRHRGYDEILQEAQKQLQQEKVQRQPNAVGKLVFDTFDALPGVIRTLKNKPRPTEPEKIALFMARVLYHNRDKMIDTNNMVSPSQSFLARECQETMKSETYNPFLPKFSYERLFTPLDPASKREALFSDTILGRYRFINFDMLDLLFLSRSVGCLEQQIDSSSKGISEPKIMFNEANLTKFNKAWGCKLEALGNLSHLEILENRASSERSSDLWRQYRPRR